MNQDEYKKLVDELTPTENKLRNALVAFLVGGLIGFVGEVVVHILMTSFGLESVEAYTWLCLLLILFGSTLTALGFFDNWVTRVKAGLIVPTTGFAHSITSAALDYKKEGLITGLGANFFKLAGSVLLYGIIASFFLSIIGVIFHG